MGDLERIRTVVKWLIGQGVADNQEGIGNLLGYANKSSFSQLMNGKKPIPTRFMTRLAALHDKLNYAWIATGEGAMLASEAVPVSGAEFIQVPLVPVSAQAGYPQGYGDFGYIESLPTVPVIVDKFYHGNYRVFEVNGDSMDDGSRHSIFDKDKILCREVRRELWKNKLHIKDWFFVIVHRTEGVTVKQIIEHDVETGEIVCHPLNPLFENFALNLDDVVELYNVIKIVDRNIRI
ncbi:MAG: S24 family peptidase [Dysgonomonas sp.]|nr:S24 family peptidase [Dysgonomonas sp.]